ncbi:MAG: tryptophan-rich sensory protein [Bacteroidales bacterium]|jgi:hypothetical protein|nr:tryptophan-rich sensory protein [Bacteroidales bacterium]MDD4385324.1 tryptophan-rich sensory protein [Bacteroidales bacterium]MDY0198270.1 tryptophan-rich sensory protein [Tenuifilaceae bacterium]
MAYKIINLIAFAVMVLMNYLANAIPLNGKTTGALSAEYPNLFVPTGATFSIWGVIYLMLLLFIILQFFQSNSEIVKAVGWAFAISCLFNSLWIFAWHYQMLPLSLIIMLGLLITLIFIGVKLQAYSLSISKASFGIYLGWVCIATIANVTALLVNYKWGGWGLSEQTWAIAMVAIGAIITLLATIRFSNPFVGLAVIWAFIGIVIEQKGAHPAIVTTAIIGITVVGIVTILSFIGTKGFAKG